MKKNIYAVLVFCMIIFVGCSKNDVTNTAANNTLNNKPTGSSANDFLSANTYKSIQIEIAYMPGYAPDGAALNNLVSFLNTLINKPGGIQIIQRPIAASGNTILTLAEITALEKANRTVFSNGTTLGVCLLFVDADYNEPNVLGVAYKNTSMVIFAKKIHENSGGINQASLTKLETTVEEHEFGHLLGLVNLGSNMQTNHEDAAHEKHCNNSACLMYYATQVNMMGGILVSAPVPGLDANCKNDLTANGGK